MVRLLAPVRVASVITAPDTDAVIQELNQLRDAAWRRSTVAKARNFVREHGSTVVMRGRWSAALEALLHGFPQSPLS